MCLHWPVTSVDWWWSVTYTLCSTAPGHKPKHIRSQILFSSKPLWSSSYMSTIHWPSLQVKPVGSPQLPNQYTPKGFCSLSKVGTNTLVPEEPVGYFRQVHYDMALDLEAEKQGVSEPHAHGCLCSGGGRACQSPFLDLILCSLSLNGHCLSGDWMNSWGWHGTQQKLKCRDFTKINSQKKNCSETVSQTAGKQVSGEFYTGVLWWFKQQRYTVCVFSPSLIPVGICISLWNRPVAFFHSYRDNQ